MTKMTGNCNIVKLNIGGIIYQTTTQTLTQRGLNFFTALFEVSFPSTIDENGAYFIDRNGKLFEPLLDYLRSGKLFIPKNISRAAILEEAAFYSIELPESEKWEGDNVEYCILEISAKYMTQKKIFFRLYHDSFRTPEVVGEVSTAGYWEVQKKHVLANLMCQMGREGWELKQVLGTENDDGTLPESYVFAKQNNGTPLKIINDLIKKIKFQTQ